MAGTEVPTGVKVISVCYYIGAVVLFIVGILCFVGGGFIGPLLTTLLPFLGTLATGLFIVCSVIAIGFGVLSFFVGRGLWKGRNWARIVAIVFTFLGVLSAIFSIPVDIVSGIFSLLVNLVIALYLLLSSSVKKAFE